VTSLHSGEHHLSGEDARRQAAGRRPSFMRFLGIGKGNDLGDMYLRLQAAGHDVRVHVDDPDSRDILAGMLRFIPDWRGELPWIREANEDGIIVFEGIGWGERQDELRAQGYHVVGGSGFGDRLESDRAFGQEWMHLIGMQTAAVREFDDFEEGRHFLEANPARYVLKFSGQGFASTRNYVGVMDSGADMIAVLDVQRRRWKYAERPEFILMEHVQGVEVGVGAFFNGRDFLRPANLDWEHKRFFPGDLGELTGEMGTLATYRGAEAIFERTLAKMRDPLRQSGYCGYINLNTIVNNAGIWPLEFTCRFGYPGFPILDSLHRESWDGVLSRLVGGRDLELPTHDGWSVCVVLTVPTFPYWDGYERMSKGAPILFRETMTEEDREHLHFGEVAMADGRLVTAGSVGYVLVVTGLGSTVEQAQRAAYGRAEKVVMPNVRYRLDIGEKFLRRDRDEMVRLGLLPAPQAPTSS
jgi:phosphoribosylamine--glycine ligase